MSPLEPTMSKSIEKPEHYYRAPRREMLAFVPTDARSVLEIGCGEGGFGAELKRVRHAAGIDVNVTGVEKLTTSCLTIDRWAEPSPMLTVKSTGVADAIS